jgi:hypothetical protein
MSKHVTQDGVVGQIERVNATAGQILQNAEKEDAHPHGNHLQVYRDRFQGAPQTQIKEMPAPNERTGIPLLLKLATLADVALRVEQAPPA